MILTLMQMNVQIKAFLLIIKEGISFTMQKMRMGINFRYLIREIM